MGLWVPLGVWKLDQPKIRCFEVRIFKKLIFRSVLAKAQIKE